MKKTILLLATLMITGITTFSQWTQKQNFPDTARCYAAGFSIGSKGYIGTGYPGFYNDFWEWDGDTASLYYNTWTQDADFPADGRCMAIGFSVGTKGYIALGNAGGWKNDFWEYNPVGNSWGYAGIAGLGKEGAVCFSVGAKAYFGTGFRNGTDTKDFWEFNPSTYNYTQIADYPGAGGNGVEGAVGFSIGPYGYVGTGATNTYNVGHNDFWQYDTLDNIWTQKASLPANRERFLAVGFSIGNKGYIGTGHNGYDNSGWNDFWEYTYGAGVGGGTWTQKADFGGAARYGATGFSIGTKGYIGTGLVDGNTYFNDFWEYYDSTIVVNITKITDENVIKIFPNPATDNLEIETSQKSSRWLSGEILNIQGKLIKSIVSAGNKTNVDVSKIPGGIYFIKLVVSGAEPVKTDKGIIIKKFVKIKL